MFAIYRKEMKVYFSGMFGYFITALLLLFAGLFTVLFHFVFGYSQFAYTLTSMNWVLIVLIPFLSMRAIAEERHNRTDQLLYSLPIPMWEIVMGKFLALVTLFSIPTAVMAVYPLMLSAFGGISLPAAYGALLGYYLLGIALIALCLFISSLVENQILAAVLSLAALLVVYFGWILFRYSDMSMGTTVFKGLFGLNGNPLTSFTATAVVKNHVFLLGFSVLASTPLFRLIGRWLGNLSAHNRVLSGVYQVVAYGVLPVTLLLLSTAALVGSTYNPFMYFQF